MNKIIKVAIIAIGFITMGLFQNCSNCTGEYYMVENTLSIKANNEFVDSNKIEFEFYARSKCMCSMDNSQSLFIHAANATDNCDQINITEIDSTKTEFRIDKRFFFMGDTIEPNTNLYTDLKVKDYLNIPNSIEGWTQYVNFNPNFYEDFRNLTFDAGDYIFYIKWISTDGKVFESSVTEFVDLKY